MKIGIDARPLQGETQFRGIGKSLGYMLEAFLASHLGNNSYIFYVDSGLPIPELLRKFPNYKLITVNSLALGKKRFFRSVLPSFRSPRPSRRDIDVFFQYDAALGIPITVPTVTIFHDAIPLLFKGKEPKQYVSGLRKYKNALAGSLYWKKYQRVLKRYKRSRKLIAISHSSKKDFLKHIGGVATKNIAVIPLGVTGFDSSGKVSSRIKDLSKQPYILYVGGIDLRKNVKGLLETFYSLKKTNPDLRLITVGKEFELGSQLRDMGWHDILDSNKDFARDVIKPGYVSQGDLAHLYKHAVAFVLTSRYEGFGMPILEAFQAGCPVVAYDNSSIPDVAGDAALLVEDGQALAPAIQRLIGDPALRENLVARGHKQAKQFTWERAANATVDVLEEATKT